MNSAVKPGRIEEITSTANPRIKSIKALALKKNRDADGLFLAEGEKLAHDALSSGWVIRNLLFSKRLMEADETRQRIEALAVKARARGGDVLITTDKILTSITRRDNPQAVIVVMEQKIDQVDSVKVADNITWLALDRVRDPGNLGTIIRTADALGVTGILLVGETTDPFAIEAVRATMGSLFHVPLVRQTEEEFLTLAGRWKSNGGQVVGTHLKGSTDHRLIDYATGPQLILMGNEQQGLTDELAACCSSLARIAMSGEADSLNLAVATGIMLFEVRRHALKPSDT